MRRLSIGDWRLYLSIGLCLFGFMFVYVYIDQARTVDYFIAEGKRERAATEKARAEASQERKETLKKINELQGKYDALLATNRGFVIWLRQQGIEVPDRFIAPENRIYYSLPDDDDDDNNDDSRGGVSGNPNEGSVNNPSSNNSSNDEGGGDDPKVTIPEVTVPKIPMVPIPEVNLPEMEIPINLRGITNE